MPGMDGIQVLEEMQRRELLDDIPVIMITADTSADSMSHAYELGVADYIERPFDVQVVRRRVMNTVKLYARQRRLTSVLIQQARAQERISGMMADVLARIVAYRNGEGGDHARHIRRLTELLLERLTERPTGTGSPGRIAGALRRRPCFTISASWIFPTRYSTSPAS